MSSHEFTSDAQTITAPPRLVGVVSFRYQASSPRGVLTPFAQASGIETPTRTDLAEARSVATEAGRNAAWQHPHDSDTWVEHAVDCEGDGQHDGARRGSGRYGLPQLRGARSRADVLEVVAVARIVELRWSVKLTPTMSTTPIRH